MVSVLFALVSRRQVINFVAERDADGRATLIQSVGQPSSLMPRGGYLIEPEEVHTHTHTRTHARTHALHTRARNKKQAHTHTHRGCWLLAVLSDQVVSCDVPF